MSDPKNLKKKVTISSVKLKAFNNLINNVSTTFAEEEEQVNDMFMDKDEK